MAATKRPTVGECRTALHAWWGESSGSIEGLAAVEQQVRDAKLTSKQILHDLIPSVPASGSGLTGQRCQRAVAMLRRLAGE